MNDLVGIAIVHYGDPEATRRCLEAIRRDPSEVPRRIVVVDNSGDFPAGLLEEGEERLTSADNPGFGEGANRGLRYLLDRESPRWLLALNHDAEIDPGFLDGARRALERGGVGAAGGPIYSRRDKRALWYAGGSVNRLTGTVRQSTSPADARSPRPVGFVPGTALALSAQAFEELAGFDGRFFLYNEDLDLCRRLVARGFEVFFEPSMGSRHRLGAATGSEDRSPLYLEHLSAGRFLPFKSKLYRAYLGLLHTPYVILRCGVLALRYRAGAGPRIAALLRGHRRALGTIWADPPPVAPAPDGPPPDGPPPDGPRSPPERTS